MTIKFFHTPIEQIDRLCKEEQIVRIMISTYQVEALKDGTIVEIETGGFGGTIKSSKDLIQFDNEDMKVLTQKTKKEMR
jgi:hypothetical protein